MRSYRELWLWLGALFLTLFLFLAAVAIAYFAKGTHYSLFLNGWMLGALICFLASYTCFFAALRGWPFPPGTRPGFPDVEVEIYGTGAIGTQRESESGLAVPAGLLYLRLVPGYYLDKVAEPVSMRLELWDHLTDRRMTVPAEIGRHDKAQMIPSSGGAELLGPEYESQPGEQSDTRQASA